MWRTNIRKYFRRRAVTLVTQGHCKGRKACNCSGLYRKTVIKNRRRRFQCLEVATTLSDVNARLARCMSTLHEVRRTKKKIQCYHSRRFPIECTFRNDLFMFFFAVTAATPSISGATLSPTRCSTPSWKCSLKAWEKPRLSRLAFDNSIFFLKSSEILVSIDSQLGWRLSESCNRERNRTKIF